MKPPKYSFGFFHNSTHVGIEKVHFPKAILASVDGAIKQIADGGIGFLQEDEFVILSNAISKYDKKNAGKQVYVYMNHFYIGMIKPKEKDVKSL